MASPNFQLAAQAIIFKSIILLIHVKPSSENKFVHAREQETDPTLSLATNADTRILRRR